jgi:hypothetical protein
MIAPEGTMVWITEATHVGDYQIRLRFNDGAEGVADLRETFFSDERAIFVELRDREAFGRFRVAMDTVVWENGLDLAPEFLRELVMIQQDNRMDPAVG